MTSDHYLKPYQESIKKHGSNFDATLWANPASQERRFKVFAEMCFLPGKRILDAGCSRGDFGTFLVSQDIAYDRYIGVDALEEVVSFARDRGLPRSEFYQGDFVTDPQVLQVGDPQIICISGSLNTMTDDQLIAVLESAWASTSQSLLFNFLSDCAARGAPQQTGPARRLDTRMLLDWAFQKSWSVAFRQDYFDQGHDAAIHLQKP